MIRLFILALLLMVQALTPAQARLSHVSINKSQFTLGEYPRLRVNIVSERSDLSRLEFVVRQGTREEKLMVEPLNNFMLLLFGVDNVTDANAELVVREYVVNQWQEYKVIPLFGGTERVAKAPSAPPRKAAELLAPESVPVAKPTPAQMSLASAANDSGGCAVEYQPGETLWRIASRYAPRWNTNVYSTMMALFDANPRAFTKGKISGLKQDAKLECPSPALLGRYPDTREARRIFEAKSLE